MIQSDTPSRVHEKMVSEGDTQNVDDIFCPNCDYNLRGVESDRCPECGVDIIDVKQRKSIIPWVHRAEIGRVRAYWKTVWLVSFGFKRFCQEMSRPAQLNDARRFRWVTVVVAFLPWVSVASIRLTITQAWGSPLSSGATAMWMLFLIGLLATIIYVSSIAHYTLRHRDIDIEWQHRAAVLYLYAGSATMAWMFVAALLVLASMAAHDWLPNTLFDGILAVIAAIVFFLIVISTHGDVHQGTHARSKVPVFASLKVGFFWAIGGLTVFIGIPVSIVFLALVYYSL